MFRWVLFDRCVGCLFSFVFLEGRNYQPANQNETILVPRDGFLFEGGLKLCEQ